MLVALCVRCGNDNGVGPAAEVISTPSAPSGHGGLTPVSPSLIRQGATSSLGHSVEYRFDWGDGNYSEWSSSTSGSHAWSTAGIYLVKAEFR